MTPLILGLLSLAVGGIVALWRGTDSAEGEGTFGNRVSAAANNFLGLDKDGNQQFYTALQTNLQGAQDQRDWEEKMYYIDRDYTSPANQMRLYREAGLNPSLMYGQPIQTGQIGSGAEATSPSPSSGQLGALSSLLGLGQDAMMMPAQVDLMRAQADEIRSRIPVNQQKVSTLKAQIADIFASVDQKRADIQLKLAQTNLTNEQKFNISFEQMLKSGQLNLDYLRYGLEQEMTDAQVKRLDADTRQLLARASITEREYQEMVWTFAIRRAGLEKQNFLTDAQIRVANATAAKLSKEGIRLDEVISNDAVHADAVQRIADGLNSDKLINRVGAGIMYGVEYLSSTLLGKLSGTFNM